MNIPDLLRSDALPWVSLAPGFSFKLLRATSDDDVWVELLRLEPGTTIGRHRHTGEVHAYTLAGQRQILETGQLVGPGEYVYEPPGNVDSWRAVGSEPVVVYVTVRGAIEYLDDRGQVTRRSTARSAADAYRRGTESADAITKPWLLAAAALALVLSCFACKSANEPQQAADSTPNEGELRAAVAGAHRLGMPAPAITVKTIDGETIDLAMLYGRKPVYLKFWATWCTPCREQMPAFEHIYETLGDRIQVIAVNAGLSDDVAAVRAFREKYGLHMPIVIDDGSLAAALDLQVTPQHVLVGRVARIAYIGHQDGPKLDEAIQKVLSEPISNGPGRGQPVVLPAAFRPGDVVRGLSAKLSDGSTVEIGPSCDGRPRALVFFADWCESYLEETQPRTSQACRRVRESVDRLAARGDVEWLGIAMGVWSSAQSIDEYKTQTKTRLPVALDADGALFRAFGVRDMPTVVLLDPDGRVVRQIGPDDGDLEARVATLR